MILSNFRVDRGQKSLKILDVTRRKLSDMVGRSKIRRTLGRHYVEIISGHIEIVI